MKYIIFSFLLCFSFILPAQPPGVLLEPIDISQFPSAPKLTKSDGCFDLTVFVDRSVTDSIGFDSAQNVVNRTIEEFLPAYDTIETDINVVVKYLNTNFVGTSYEIYLQTAQITDWDDAMLLFTFETRNGIASVDALGTQYARGVCGIHLDDVRAYTARFWNKMVTAHELGHIIGSQHTHNPVWNENNTPIDSCGYGIRPIIPSTIMSYCHLYGMLTFKFNPQVVALLNKKLEGAGLICVAPECEITRVARIVNNYFPGETTWKWGESSGGPYPKDSIDVLIQACAERCDTLFIYDSEGDGFSSDCLQGSVSVVGRSYTFYGDTLAVTFCDPPTSIPCIDISKPTVYEQQIREDRTGIWLFTEGNTITLRGNSWWDINIDYTATSNSVIRFEAKGDGLGEIQGVHLTERYFPFDPAPYDLYGTQAHGSNRTIRPDKNVWRTVEIPLTPGDKNHLWLINDKDQGDNICEVSFRNFCITETSSLKTESQTQDIRVNILGQPTSRNVPGFYIKDGKKVIVTRE